MSTLYLYNPENDIALGHDPGARFTPPRAAERLARYGSPLLWWMAREGDSVYVPEPEDEAYARELAAWHDTMAQRFGHGAAIVHTLDVGEGVVAEPWGWSAHTARMIAQGGAKVPDTVTENLDMLRNLSHRRTSIEINRRLREALSGVYGHQLEATGAVEAKTADQADEALRMYGGEVFVKSPWSSSGRGVADGRRMTEEKLRERCLSAISRQGSVLIEPAYGKLADFAMLFRSDGRGRVSGHGLSVFFNERGASYTGNVVASDSRLRNIICRNLPERLLCDVNAELERILSGLVGSHYRGYLGVDMMAVAGKGGLPAMVPCVELNLRMTMGVVAHELYSRPHACGAQGADDMAVMKTIPGKRPTATPGALPLVPYNDYFNIELTEG